LVAGEHVSDRFGESAGEVELGDLGAALFAEAGFRFLVVVVVEGVLAGVRCGFDQRPAQVTGSVLGERAAPVGASGLVDARAEAGVAGEPSCAGKRSMSPISAAIV
jgi:hypothetical protein